MAKKKFYLVHFTGQRGQQEASEDFQQNETSIWQRWLKHSRDNKKTTVVTCRCLPAENDPVRRRLKVHYSRDTERCWLSSYAFTGNEHKPDCRFYSVWSDERQAEIYQGEAVRAAADGTIVVRLPTGLQKKAPSDAKTAENASADEPVKRKRRPSMSLLGLLHLLWEQSGINVCHPAFDKKKRSPGWVSWRLQHTAVRIRIGRVPLEESLLLMAMKGTQQVIANREHLRSAEKNKRRLIVVSMLAGWSEAAEARLKTMLPLGLFSGFPDLVMPEDVRLRLERSFSRELSDWRRGMKVMVITETEQPETSFRHIDGRNRPSSCSTVIDVALMTVSPRFIPLDSSYESAVEEKLWQEKRAFIKKLRYDGEDGVFPDFVLKDVPGVDALPMEVFGMNTPEYLLRKQDKTSHYESEYGPGRWWSWEATVRSEIPAFPSCSAE
ncbi:DUF1173 family protein [Pantoea allii]|uniref:DUF1173 domain-containing protein n=1 Tax=Pantoea allii TaxID=574096 RepID=A0ABS6VLG7_9GAMM|nr:MULTISPECIES: DUF1173 family protein [Pantoea]MBW1216267.1 DUF1173 domain-containing protein [Pantoea allii]MBW1255552.1 DUF1173 domain-containing protein [Pantoea allii]MBW1259905.1 DUF1173 domain-containing protein [Pantoea allii]MBW1264633.1 DUF1173 domain-containing protein [Pantoea allii]MBW1269005.1 DUF1173 domain-containing protein [Pantoea allii]